MRYPPRSVICLLALGAGLLLAGCGNGVLNPQGPVGAAERTILLNSLAIMLAIVIPTTIATLAFAWWFRASNPRAQYRPDWSYSGRVELVVWSIPTLVILFLGGIIWIGSHQLDPATPLDPQRKPLEVQAVSLDWKWLFIYPEQGIATVNQLTVPAGQPVHFTLTSASVMNAFFLPQLGSMIYTMNAVTPDVFQAWVTATKRDGPTLDRAGYEALAQPSMNVKPAAYRSVDPKLFHAIVTQEVPPSPGPQTGKPSPDVKPK